MPNWLQFPSLATVSRTLVAGVQNFSSAHAGNDQRSKQEENKEDKWSDTAVMARRLTAAPCVQALLSQSPGEPGQRRGTEHSSQDYLCPFRNRQAGHVDPRETDHREPLTAVRAARSSDGHTAQNKWGSNRHQTRPGSRDGDVKNFF